jgi:hypothetical protein
LGAVARVSVIVASAATPEDISNFKLFVNAYGTISAVTPMKGFGQSSSARRRIPVLFQ